MIKAVIFDMDGLMIETEHLQSQSFEHVLRSHGVEPEFNEDQVIQKVGITARDNIKMLKEKHNLPEDVDILLDKKRKFYNKLLLQNITPKEGLITLVKNLKEKNIKLAVASSSPLEHIKLVLNQLGIIKDFTVLISGETLERGKPYPDIFLVAAKQLRVMPENCLVLEDAESGVLAAHAAGMKIFAVPSKYTKSHDFSKADQIVDSLQSVTMELIHSL